MLQITARIFDGSQLVGYEVTDGCSTQQLSKVDTWRYAKNKQIINVTATGSQFEPVLSGTNGFELKTLPQVQKTVENHVKTENLKLDIQDHMASYIRHAYSSGELISAANKNEQLDKIKELTKNDIEKNILTKANRKSLSNSIYVLNTLCDTAQPPNAIIVKPLIEEKEEEDISEYWKKFMEIMEILQKRTYLVEKAFKEYGYPKKLSSDSIRKYFIKSNLMNEFNSYNIKLAELIVELEEKLGGDDKQVEANQTIESLKEYMHGDMPYKAVCKAVDAIKQTIKLLDEQLNNIKLIKELAGIGRGLMETHGPIGYRIKNIGKQPIPYLRITIDENHYTSEKILNIGETICLNKMETALLASKPEIGCTFANGKIVSRGLGGEDIYKTLDNMYFTYSDETSVNDPRVKLDIRKIDNTSDMNKEIIDKYFCPVNKSEQKKQVQQKTTQKLKNTSSAKGIYNAFKR